MKKAFILFILLSLSGCAFLESQKLNWEACKASEECMADAKKWQATGEMVGGIAGSVAPGAAMPAQKAAGFIALGLAMLLGGHAINKKKEEK